MKSSLTLNRRKAELLRDICISDSCSIIQRHAPHQFGQIAGARNCRTAAKGLEFDVANSVACGVDPDLKLHNVAASGSTYETGANVGVGLGHGSNISRFVVVVEQCYECQLRVHKDPRHTVGSRENFCPAQQRIRPLPPR
jgi:hypothetical protein